MKSAVALNLALQTVEQIALEFHNLAAAQAGHVDMIALRPALIEVFLALHVHEIELIDQSMALQQTERAVHGNPIDLRIQFARATENLAGVEVLFGSFDDAENRASLPRHAQAARHQFSLQPSRSFGLRKGQSWVSPK